MRAQRRNIAASAQKQSLKDATLPGRHRHVAVLGCPPIPRSESRHLPQPVSFACPGSTMAPTTTLTTRDAATHGRDFPTSEASNDVVMDVADVQPIGHLSAV